MNQAFLRVACLTFSTLLLSMCLVSCERSRVGGMVVDISGEPLPGVCVSVLGTARQAITDSLGHFTLSYGKETASEGNFELSFVKTGYTKGTLAVEAGAVGQLTARTMTLWPLPRTSGAFLFEDFHYRRMSPIEPKPYSEPEGAGVVHGVRALPEAPSTAFPEPLILLHKVPPYDVRMNRLCAGEGVPPEAAAAGMEGAPQEIWIGGEGIRIDVEPVDAPEALLREVKVFEPLEEGVYALHWGALDGYTMTDTRIFVFSVEAPPQPEEAEAPGETAVVETGVQADDGDASAPQDEADAAPPSGAANNE